MTVLLHCMAQLPAYVCRHKAVLVYLVPSVLLAVLIRALAARHPFFFVFTLAGTVCHELAHFCAGLVTGAKPGSFTVIPRRSGQGWHLGSVTLTRVRWYNAAPAALAPLLILAIPLLVAQWRTGPGWRFTLVDLALAFALAPQFLSCWPSSPDWKIAVRSWPWLLICAAGGWAWMQLPLGLLRL